jgi:hypothetical protein
MDFQPIFMQDTTTLHRQTINRMKKGGLTMQNLSNTNTPTGKQAIHCNVKSCRHNAQNSYCALQSISVAPCGGGSSGMPQDESMCASYEVQ